MTGRLWIGLITFGTLVPVVIATPPSVAASPGLPRAATESWTVDTVCDTDGTVLVEARWYIPKPTLNVTVDMSMVVRTSPSTVREAGPLRGVWNTTNVLATDLDVPSSPGNSVRLFFDVSTGDQYTVDRDHDALNCTGQVIEPVFTSWDAFVSQQMLDFRGSRGSLASRAADVAALRHAGIGPSDYIVQQMYGAWFGSHVEPVARLYWAYFGRIPDYGGLTYWAGKHRSGTRIAQISEGFARSNEFTTRYGSLSNRAFITRIYTTVLGRAADTAGVNFWTRKLETGTSRGQAMVNFSESNEYRTKMATKVGVLMAYAGLLRRSPSAGELTSGSGQSLLSLVEAIRLSAPYNARVP